MCIIFFFFFSSRRRHTRFDCDWSSDVCSSDLAIRHVDTHVILIQLITIVLTCQGPSIGDGSVMNGIPTLIESHLIVYSIDDETVSFTVSNIGINKKEMVSLWRLDRSIESKMRHCIL